MSTDIYGVSLTSCIGKSSTKDLTLDLENWKMVGTTPSPSLHITFQNVQNPAFGFFSEVLVDL